MDEPLSYKEKRDNFKKRFLSSGFLNFTNEEILEFFISYAAPSKDNGSLARHLLESCGTIANVMDAPDGVLADNNVSENAYILLKSIPELSKIYLNEKYSDNPSKTLLENKIITAFMGVENEHVLLVLLDNKGKELYFGFIKSGTFNLAEISIRQIIDLCMKYKAKYAMIAHNHPSGIAYPSIKDVETTVKLNNALAALDIDLINHLIISGPTCFSMSSNEEFYDIFL